MQQGYIKLYRKLLESPLWQSCKPERKTILITILLKANHKEKTILLDATGEEITLLPGQFVTSRKALAEACGKGISEQMVRSALDCFQKCKFLTKQSTKGATKGYTLITVENWEFYQSDNKNQPSSQPTNQPFINQLPTKNKNEKNEKNNIYSSNFDKLWNLYPNKQGKKTSKTKVIKLLKDNKVSFEELKRCIERYKSYVENRRKNGFSELSYMNGSTFFNGRYEDYLDENYKEVQQDPVENTSKKYDNNGYELF